MQTLDQCLKLYLKVDRAPATNEQYAHILRRMVRAIGPARSITRIRYEDLLDYDAQLRASGLKPVTLAGYTSAIKAFFNWCVGRRYIKRSPAADIKRRRRDADSHVSRAVPPAELRAMVECARHTSPRNYALLLFMADTGCRVGGLISLTLERLDLDDRSALLLEKGDSWHRVFYGDQTADALRAWLRKRPPAAHAYVWTGKAPGYKPLQASAVRFILRRLAEATDASRIWTPHDIRRSVGHAFAKHGIPAPTTAQKLGHSDVQITLKHYYPNDENFLRRVSADYALVALRDPQPQSAEPRLVKRA